jgi:DNA-binding NtrC family response regulator
MPSRATEEFSERLPIRPSASFEFSASERAFIGRLIGHTLARIEREYILQTLRYNKGNRTRSANVLGISIRSLRDRLRIYRSLGESVPEPGSPLLECLEEITDVWSKVTEELDVKS